MVMVAQFPCLNKQDVTSSPKYRRSFVTSPAFEVYIPKASGAFRIANSNSRNPQYLISLIVIVRA
jgi:hypothetical protein